jgi:hypothetical protein
VPIRPAVSADAAAIATVQVRSWRAAYRGLLPQEELDALDIGRRTETWTRILAASQWPRSGTLVAARRFYEAAGWAPDGAVRQDGVAEVRYTWPRRSGSA